MSDHVVEKKTYYAVFAGLIALLGVTVMMAYVHLGRFNVVVALTIAFVKAVMIILYFMHLRYSSRLLWVFAGAGFFWLGILFVLTSTDYLTRVWLSIPAGAP